MAEVNQQLIDDLTELSKRAKGTVDTSAKIKVGDTEISVADAIVQLGKIKELEKQNAELADIKARTVELLRPDLPKERKKENLIAIYKQAGLSDAEATAFADAEVADTNIEPDPKKGTQKATKFEVDLENPEQVKLLREKLGISTLERVSNEDYREKAREWLGEATNRHLDEHAEIKTLLTRLYGSVGEEEKASVTEYGKSLKDEIIAEAGRAVVKLHQATGKVTKADVDEAVKTATIKVAKTQKAVIVATQQLDRATETVPAELRALKDKPPVQAPSTEDAKKMSSAELKEKVEAYMADGFARDQLEQYEEANSV